MKHHQNSRRLRRDNLRLASLTATLIASLGCLVAGCTTSDRDVLTFGLSGTIEKTWSPINMGSQLIGGHYRDVTLDRDGTVWYISESGTKEIVARGVSHRTKKKESQMIEGSYRNTFIEPNGNHWYIRMASLAALATGYCGGNYLTLTKPVRISRPRCLPDAETGGARKTAPIGSFCREHVANGAFQPANEQLQGLQRAPATTAPG
jgi:hypothetical protein